MTEDIIRINSRIDLIYSPDNGGWYFYKYGDASGVNDYTSQVFKTKADAKKAFKENSIEWN